METAKIPDCSTNASRRERGLTAVILVLLGLLGIIVFARGFASELVFDSVLIIRDDTRLSGFTFENLSQIFTEDYWWPTMSSDLYRPLTTLSFFFEKVILGFGVNPAPYQVTNLALHLAVAGGGVFLFRRLGLGVSAASLATAWFIIHPYAAEVVPNIVGRSDLLALISILAGLGLYLRCIRQKSFTNRSILAWGGILIAGCVSKESALSGLAIVVWHGFTLSPESWSRAREVRPLKKGPAVLAVAVIILALCSIGIPKILFKERAGEKIEIAGDNPLVAQSFFDSRINAIAILGDNLVNTWLPYRVSADYSYNQIPLFSSSSGGKTEPLAIIAATATGLLILAVVFWLRKRDPLLAFFLGGALLSLAPTANLVVHIGTVCADRLVYPAIWFMSGAGALLLDRGLKHLQNINFARNAAIAGLAVGVGTVACYTHFRCTDWRSKKQFWASAFASAPQSYKSRLGYGSVMVQSDDYAEAKDGLDYLQTALEILQGAPWRSGEGTSIFANQTAGACWLQFARIAKEHGTPEEVTLALNQAAKNLGDALDRINSFNAKYSKNKEGADDESKLARVDMLCMGLAEVLRAQDRPEAAADLLETHFHVNQLNVAYLESLGFASLEAGRRERGESCLYQALVLNDKNRELSRVIHTWTLTNSIPPQKRALAGDAASVQQDLAPPLDLEDTKTVTKLKAAARDICAALDAKKRLLEKARLQRILRIMLRSGLDDPATDSAAQR